MKLPLLGFVFAFSTMMGLAAFSLVSARWVSGIERLAFERCSSRTISQANGSVDEKEVFPVGVTELGH